MNNTNTGGPAFPEVRIISGDNYNAPTKVYYGGMTLRDYFAAKAIPELTKVYSYCNADPTDYADGIANDAYKIADAMLKEREQ
jgi:hypothetical protein